MFDLEDAVALREKDTLATGVPRCSTRCIRISKPWCASTPSALPFGLLDLEAAVHGGVDVIRLPKTDTPEDIYELEGHLARIERECGREWVDPRRWRRLNPQSG